MKKNKAIKAFDFVDYLKKIKFTINNLIKEEHCRDNFLSFSFPCAVIELLGECFLYSKEKSKRKMKKRIDGGKEATKSRFECFLGKFLNNYSKYEPLLRGDLRNGAAHFGFPKGVIVPSYDRKAKKDHLKFIKDPYTNTMHLIIYSPQFLKDLNSAIKDFICCLRKKTILEGDCIEVMKKIMQNGQRIIKKAKDLRRETDGASKKRLYRDTYPHFKLRR